MHRQGTELDPTYRIVGINVIINLILVTPDVRTRSATLLPDGLGNVSTKINSRVEITTIQTQCKLILM
jgi:hypothetical protein